MSRYRRLHTPGATFFFTLATQARQDLLTTAPVRNALRQAIVEVRSQAAFEIHAWVLLPDHLHCIWELPPGDADYGVRWSIIKRRVTQACASALDDAGASSASRIKRRDGALWQRRFWEHQIRDEDDFARHVDYIHFNPVKHGCVQRVSDWPYSTFHRYVKAGIYAPDWGGAQQSDIPGDFGE
jgi:putative transposase